MIGILDVTDYSKNTEIKYYRIYYKEHSFFLKMFCCCLPKCMFQSDYIYQMGISA